MTVVAPRQQVQAEPAPAAPVRSRVGTGAVLRGVGAALAVAAVVAVVRGVLGYRADETALSARFSQLVSYEVWRTLLGVTVALWMAVGVSAARRLRRLPGGVDRTPVGVATVAWLVVVAALFLVLSSGDGGPDNPLWGARPKVLTMVVVALVAASPLVVGLWCTRAWLEDVQAELRSPPDADVPVGRRVAELLVVRGIIDAALRAGAVGITAVVAATGALRNALIVVGVETETSWPPSWLLFYGGVFTVVFAAVFVPAHLRWDTVADELVGRAVPLPDDGLPDDAWHARRTSLRTVLDRQQSLMARLGSGLAIAAPLVTSALAALVPQLGS